MDKPRDIVKIIDRIIELVPEYKEEEWGDEHEKLINRLTDIKDIAFFTAPEAQYLLWEQLAEGLADEIGTPSEDWQKKISKLILNKE